jgi:ABC-type multidrug transport system fused ATPase/permease subunit
LGDSGQNAVLTNIYRRLEPRRRRQFWLLFAAICCVALVETGTMGVTALFASSITDPETVLRSSKVAQIRAYLPAFLFTDGRALIVSLSVATALLLALKNSLTAVISYFNGLYSALVDAHFGDLLLAGFLHRRYEWHLYHNSADLITLLGWRRNIGNVMIYMAIQSLSDGVMVVVLGAALFFLSPEVSVVVCGVLGLAALGVYKGIRPWFDRTARKASALDLSVNRQVTKALHGIKDVKVCGREEPFMQDYRVDVLEFARTEALQRMLARCPAWILEATGFAMVSAIVLLELLVLEASTARITGTVALLAVAAWRVLPAINRILSSVTAIRQALPQTSQVLDHIMECEADLALNAAGSQTQAAVSPLSFSRAIELAEVSFTYGQSPEAALDGVSLAIGKGRSIGLVGRSGSGKSTLVDTVIGLLAPSSGRVLVDGRELAPELARSWLDRIGYVGQTPYIYDGTLAENVAFGLHGERIDREKVRACCEQAAMLDFLGDLPQGLDTPIGERGTRLSGGQRQRVAIARALYRNPEILVLDEATSALDEKSEDSIQQTVRGLTGKQTLIIIAHRLTTVEGCDQVVWLDKGRVRLVGEPGEVIRAYRAEIQD